MDVGDVSGVQRWGWMGGELDGGDERRGAGGVDDGGGDVRRGDGDGWDGGERGEDGRGHRERAGGGLRDEQVMGEGWGVDEDDGGDEIVI